MGSCLTFIVQGDTCADKARDFIGKGHLGGEQQGRETQENSSATVAHSLGFYGDGISFRVVFSQSSDSESFLVVHALLRQDGSQREAFWLDT